MMTTFECSKCNNAGTWPGMVDHFIKYHVDKERVPWTCSHCGLKAATEQSLHNPDLHFCSPGTHVTYLKSSNPYEVREGRDIIPVRRNPDQEKRGQKRKFQADDAYFAREYWRNEALYDNRYERQDWYGRADWSDRDRYNQYIEYEPRYSPPEEMMNRKPFPTRREPNRRQTLQPRRGSQKVSNTYENRRPKQLSSYTEAIKPKEQGNVQRRKSVDKQMAAPTKCTQRNETKANFQDKKDNTGKESETKRGVTPIALGSILVGKSPGTDSGRFSDISMSPECPPLSPQPRVGQTSPQPESPGRKGHQNLQQKNNPGSAADRHKSGPKREQQSLQGKPTATEINGRSGQPCTENTKQSVPPDLKDEGGKPLRDNPKTTEANERSSHASTENIMHMASPIDKDDEQEDSQTLEEKVNELIRALEPLKNMSRALIAIDFHMRRLTPTLESIEKILQPKSSASDQEHKKSSG